jgi:hypothetical protein
MRANVSSPRVPAGLLLTTLLFAIFTLSASAGPVRGYDKAHEITLAGTIQEAIAKPLPGSPAGLHLLVQAAQGTVDVHVGPYLPKDMREALQPGTTVQIVGAMVTLHGNNYLLARYMTFGGRTVLVRSENGFLVRSQASRTTTQKGSQLGGGAQ